MNKKLLTAFMMILLLGVSKTVFAERAIPIYPEIKVEYSKDIRSGGEYSKNSISLFNAAPASETSTDNDGYGREAIGKLSNGEELQKIYDKLLSGIKNFENEISIDTNLETYIDAETDSDEAAAREFIKKFIKKIANSVTQAILSDNPDLFWFGRYDSEYYYAYKEDGISYMTLFSTDGIKITNITFYPNYNTDKEKVSEMQAKMEAAAQKFIAQAKITSAMSDYDKALALHDVVCANLDYDKTQSQEWIHTAYGAFVNKLAVCDGYSKAYQYLLSKVGIKAHMAVGNSRGEGHAWNLVSLDNNWYYTDVTWDDSENAIFHEYFNITTALLEKDHSLKEDESSTENECGYSMPNCEKTDYWYMNKEEIYRVKSSELDSNKIEKMIRLNPHATVYFTDDEMTEYARDAIDNKFNKYFQDIAGKLLKEGIPIKFGNRLWNNREYHFYFYNNNDKNDIIIDDANKSKVYINTNECGNGVLMQLFYSESNVLTRLVTKPVLFESRDMFKIDMSPADGFDDYKYVKYLLWRSGTMRPVCDIKKAS